MEHKIGEFLINAGLYGKGLEISIDDLEELKQLLEGVYKIDAYCPQCGTDRVFTSNNSLKVLHPNSIAVAFYNSNGNLEEISAEDISKNAFDDLINHYSDFNSSFSCAKDENHTLTFCCRINNNHIIKYGQYPSLADLNNTDSKKYRKILGEKYSDFNRGLGLYTHGIGAGSLVYLRRIFEDLIEEAYQEAITEPGWNEEEYPIKMNEKILKLKEYLPNFLVENRKIYGLLSKGIHELPEDVCNNIFPIVRVGIELILDEKISKEEHERKKKEIANLIERLSSEVLN